MIRTLTSCNGTVIHNTFGIIALDNEGLLSFHPIQKVPTVAFVVMKMIKLALIVWRG